MKTLFFAVTMLIVSQPVALRSQVPLTPELKKQTITDLAALLPQRYAYRDVAPKLQQLLLRNLNSGKYDTYTSAEDFALAVTNDLRSLNSDRHLGLNHSPESTQPTNTGAPAPVLTPEERAKRASEFNRQMNFGFKEVRFLNGNVGYLRFDYFDAFLEYSSPVVDASMAFLTNSDAVIIDLRENGGGGSQMVNYIAGFFFKDRTLSGSSYDRLTDTTTQSFIDPQPKEKRLAATELYILTSQRTVSAAEALAYNLKYLRHATVIGEQSAGAANPGRVTRLNALFTAFIPNRHGVNIVTGSSWEGTGVPVDIPSSSDDALRIAKLEALKKLQAKATTPAKRQRFASYIRYLENVGRMRPPAVSTLRQYVGEYQGARHVTLSDGVLNYSRVGETGGQLHFIAPDEFMLAEGDITINFVRNKQKQVTAMETQWSLADSPSTARKLK